jgi:hypothetical protein
MRDPTLTSPSIVVGIDGPRIAARRRLFGAGLPTAERIVTWRS